MKPTFDVVKALDPVRWQGRVAGLVDDVGGEPLEVGTGVRLVGKVAAIDGVTSAVLHAQQLGDALVELVVAHAGYIELHRVERLHGGFIVEEPGEGRRATDEVAGGDGQAELLAFDEVR